VGGFLTEKEKREGALGKIALSSSSSSLPRQNRGGGMKGGAPGIRLSGARRRPGRGGKGRGGRGGPIPPLTSGYGGLWRAGDGGGRRWLAMAVAAALQTWGGGKRW